MADTRVQEMCTYGRAFLLVEGLAAFLLKLGSRRQVRFELDSPEAWANLNRLIPPEATDPVAAGRMQIRLNNS